MRPLVPMLLEGPDRPRVEGEKCTPEQPPMV